MTLTRLTDIIRTADIKAITKQLKDLGYTFCNNDKELRKLPIETLFNGKVEDTETFPNSKNDKTYQGGIFTQAKCYERLEFIVVNINDHKNVFPIDMLIWAKEVT